MERYVMFFNSSTDLPENLNVLSCITESHSELYDISN